MTNDAASAGSPRSSGCVVDRTIDVTLRGRHRPTTTPSSTDGIPPRIERLHRLHGTSLLHDASILLSLSPSVYATSCVIFHRFYHNRSLRRRDVWSVALGSMLLATKVEEECRTVRSIVAAFVHVYRRRRLRYGDDDALSSNSDIRMAEGASNLTVDEKENALRSVKPMPSQGPIYAEWRDAMLSAETEILTSLGFTLHWIPDSHPHRFILYFARVLEIGGGGGGEKARGGNDDDNDGVAGTGGGDDTTASCVMQASWNYCNDSCRTDLCVRYDPEVIACASILLASCDNDYDLPLIPRPWWEAFIGPDQSLDLSNACNAILAIGDANDVDNRKSRYAYVPSLFIDGPSFNDPESYLWSVA
ncbi:hypothetical protein ACHAXA_004384 [Cyclostephanos tholiformis]|uniref:Cyclin N-terminal domain-containing protein n=1 Tax=Cyclostephanos tholiformis TaxID=382380 RepID=A0ABD3RF13_9STRA